jgi:hypothetical protein
MLVSTKVRQTNIHAHLIRCSPLMQAISCIDSIVGLWKNIRRGWCLFCNYTRFELGDGSKIRFWDDVWCGELALKVAFRFCMELLVIRMLVLQLTWTFLVALFSGTLAFFERHMIGRWMSWLPSTLCCIPIEREGKGLTSFGGFILLKGSLMLDLSTWSLLVRMMSSFPWKSIWRTKFLLKWLSSLGRRL